MTFSMMFRGTYGDPTNQTFNVDASWNDTLNLCQPGTNTTYTFVLPPVATVQSTYPGGVLRFAIHNNEPPAHVIIQPHGAGSYASWSGDTVNGNRYQWYIAGDECVVFQSDSTYSDTSNWITISTGPRIRQQNDWSSTVSVPGSAKLFVAVTLTPSPSTWVDVPGAQAWLTQWLQSDSSRERVHVETMVSSSAPGDIAYFTLADTVTGNLHDPSCNALFALPIPLANTPYAVNFTYRMQGGTLFDRGYTLAPNTYRLRVRSSGSLTIGNPAGIQYETRMQVEEFSVD